MPGKPEESWIARLHAFLDPDTIKLVLSVLIIVSVIPFEGLNEIISKRLMRESRW